MTGLMGFVLAGDIGGTKVNLALCEVSAGRVRAHWLKRYASTQFESLGGVVQQYFKDIASESKVSSRDVRSASFGVPGAVVRGKARTVNLPWQELDAEDISRAIAIENLRLINDLEAMAHGVGALEEGGGLVTLRKPDSEAPGKNRAVIAPGTGLGEALMFWNGLDYTVSASEGGHADFGPQSEEQIELLRWLWPRHKHVSWEHVASGPAIHRIYRFLKETGRAGEPKDLAEELARPDVDPSPIIGNRALKGDSEICSRALDLWLFCLGAEAGNLALKSLSYGGLYIGGGVVPNILELFRRPAFFEGLDSKGRMSALLRLMPVCAIVDQHAGLYGAALVAAHP